ncbi:hypothetical protein [Faecalibaculum rodentium]|uniref:hypothetical protein n=1 Tax=Faecalibaculum rodentium TaxID=1702221 RepID=UPI00272D547E|nr:hypothetical protein [Faecalibaculum rodentium]
MTEIIILLILSLCLVLLTVFLLVCYSDYHETKQQNQQLSHALESQFIMRADSLDAYRTMLREACREGGFWEDEDAGGNEETGDY